MHTCSAWAISAGAECGWSPELPLLIATVYACLFSWSTFSWWYASVYAHWHSICLGVNSPVAVLLAVIFQSTKTSSDSSSLVESRPILGGSWIKIWIRTYGCNARAMSANSVSDRTCRTAVPVPVASSAEILSLGGRTSPISSKIVSTKVEIESGSTARSRCPVRVAVTCTVRTTTRKGRASRGTGSIPALSVIAPRLDSNRYNRLTTSL